MTPLKSSNIKAVGYEPSSRVLTVEFHSGTTHRYHHVAAELHQGLMVAASPGSYFHQHIKSKHLSTQVEESDGRPQR